jgi:hypothetical protein
VLIFKFRTGTLEELVKNPQLWTQAADFSLPGDSADESELVILSQWLQGYIEHAKGQTSPFYEHFVTIATSEAWTGILALCVDIKGVPNQLEGLLGGIDQTRFNAHHLGIEISHINGSTISMEGDSSMFGLIDYVDPNYDPRSGQQPIAPASGALYDFKVLTLQALFENTAVKDFKSLAQLTLNSLFGQPVARMGDSSNLYNTIVLKGSYQHQGGQTLYILDTLDDNTFYFDSNILNKVEIVKAQFTVSISGASSISRSSRKRSGTPARIRKRSRRSTSSLSATRPGPICPGRDCASRAWA